MNHSNLIGKKVAIKCPVYNRGRKCYGVVTGIKKQNTMFVLIEGNKKATAFAAAWLTMIHS